MKEVGLTMIFLPLGIWFVVGVSLAIRERDYSNLLGWAFAAWISVAVFLLIFG